MTLPYLKGFEKVERALTHKFLYSKIKIRWKTSYFGWLCKRNLILGWFFFFLLVRQENEKAIIHAVLINHAFTSCLEVISQSETPAQTAAASVY